MCTRPYVFTTWCVHCLICSRPKVLAAWCIHGPAVWLWIFQCMLKMILLIGATTAAKLVHISPDVFRPTCNWPLCTKMAEAGLPTNKFNDTKKQQNPCKSVGGFNLQTHWIVDTLVWSLSLCLLLFPPLSLYLFLSLSLSLSLSLFLLPSYPLSTSLLPPLHLSLSLSSLLPHIAPTLTFKDEDTLLRHLHRQKRPISRDNVTGVCACVGQRDVGDGDIYCPAQLAIVAVTWPCTAVRCFTRKPETLQYIQHCTEGER